jgi:hypothetical protein
MKKKLDLPGMTFSGYCNKKEDSSHRFGKSSNHCSTLIRALQPVRETNLESGGADHQNQ